MNPAPPVEGPQNITALYKFAQQACDYVQHTILKKTDTADGYDCNDVARRVDDAWKGTKETVGAIYDTVTAMPGAVASAYNGIGQIPLVGRGIQIVLALGTAWLVYSFVERPETHFFVPKKQVQPKAVDVPDKNSWSEQIQHNKKLRMEIVKEASRPTAANELKVCVDLGQDQKVSISASMLLEILRRHNIDPQDVDKPKNPEGDFHAAHDCPCAAG